MLDLSKPVVIRDDRSKIDDILGVSGVLWQDAHHALVRVRVEGIVEDPAFSLNEVPSEPFLVDLESGAVLNSDFLFWVATNKPDGADATSMARHTRLQAIGQAAGNPVEEERPLVFVNFERQGTGHCAVFRRGREHLRHTKLSAADRAKYQRSIGKPCEAAEYAVANWPA